MTHISDLQDAEDARFAASLTAYALGLTHDAILASGRGTPAEAYARQIAMYLSHVGYGMSLARVARAFKRDRSTVAHACHVVEDRRDDEDFDRWVERLEDGLRTARTLHRARAA